MYSDFKIKAARVDITPIGTLPLFGRLGNRQSGPIISRLEATIIVFDGETRPYVLVGMDTLYPSDMLADAVLQRLNAASLGLQAQDILWIATHTHNAPALDPTKPLLGQVDSGYLHFVAEAIASRLILLWDTPSADGSIAGGSSICTMSVYRRKNVRAIHPKRCQTAIKAMMVPNPAQKIDQMLNAIVWHGNGRPVAVLWHWPCHAVSEPDPSAISADFPAVVRDRFRTVFGNPELPVLYLPGFSSDIRPYSQSRLPLVRQNGWFVFTRKFARNSTRSQERLHVALVESVDAAFANITDIQFEGIGEDTRSNISIGELRSEVGEISRMETIAWQLPGTHLTAVSAEVSSRYSSLLLGSGIRLETGCAQQVFGYLPTELQLLEGGYEAEEFASAFSVPGSYLLGLAKSVRQNLKLFEKPN